MAVLDNVEENVKEVNTDNIVAMNRQSLKDRLVSYTRTPGSLIVMILVLLAAVITIAALLFLLVYILVNGIPYLNADLFSWEYTSENVSVVPAMINTVIMAVISLIFAIPFGIGSAIYLVEYAKKGNKLVKVVRVTAETLTGIPSIVYGLFGMLFFVTALHWRFSILAGACTLAIMVLPVILRTTEEALMAVPDSFREGSFGLGAGKLRTIFKIILPSAVPGILSGVILSIGRIVGETAALMYTAGTVADIPKSVFSSGRTLAVHMYVLASEGLHVDQAYATAVVLLILVVVINALSSFLAKKIQKS
ncbi:MAG TPA: phosphate ABC transporter permease PstA [Candidatus Anaerobutyricum avicola]|nr:phosphate ABC transporter permease PstA [Candidatus Anaerobutyricum avicola]